MNELNIIYVMYAGKSNDYRAEGVTLSGVPQGMETVYR